MQKQFTVGGATLSVVDSPPVAKWKTRDVAEFFGVMPQTVYKWVELGIIPAYRTPGGLRRRGEYRFVESEVRAAQVKREAA